MESRIVFLPMRNETVMNPGDGGTPEQRSAWALAAARDEAFRLTDLRASEFRAEVRQWFDDFHAGNVRAVPISPRIVVVEVRKSGRDIPDFALIDGEAAAFTDEELGRCLLLVHVHAELRAAGAPAKDDGKKKGGGK